MAEFSLPLRIYRWIVFLLAASYAVYYLLAGNYTGNFGGPFRHLTIWALFLSFFCASRLMAQMERRSERRWDALIASTAVINAMVVFLYWRLYFADPTSVTSDGQLGVWYREYYLHALGPALQIIDAVLFHRAFRRLRRAALVLVGLVIAYLTWAEVVVRPLNDAPVGSVTSGLPYPFLNNMVFGDRLFFYGANLGTAIVFLLAFTALSLIVARVRGVKY